MTNTPQATLASYLPFVAKPLPTPTPTATPSPAPTIPAPSWLAYVNNFREQAALHALAENQDWTQGAWLHSRYMVKEDHISHSENQSSPWYTFEGDAAGRSGNIYVSSYTGTPDRSAINFWMAAPFHAVAILDPQLFSTAFASYREEIGLWRMAATLDWQRGLGALPPALSYPISFPADGGATWIRDFRGGEWPDPWSSCPGYNTISGPALFVQFGSGSHTPQVTAHSFARGNDPLPHCVFDESSYSNPNSATQASGRLILDSRDAVVLMPRNPLLLGQTYTASVTDGGQTHVWRFTVVPPTQTVPALPATLERAGAPLP